ncbi:DcaP family trimeric outer membrane transporter [Flagellimonas sp. CMM7]|uniref:DcaP family trimeric outer membrane transporter n=1 Tax=Flagellimonas sp. CMM7 TaxID=2654676 RepID=UPI0013D88112|nr:DcaP family trimeric outer membrane transporter [Flagellimonas sp. CMM7]UII80330.1 DcaP family trimeric outer membrane transporter [Flagellimonas sp. CMM7]
MKTPLSLLFALFFCIQFNAQQNSKEDTEPLLRFYGFVRFNATYDFQDLGRSDLFRPSAISVPKESPRNSEYFMSVKQSRLGVEFNKDTEVGPVRAVVEIDFHDTSDQILGLARLRHAYLQWKGLTIGQTWSTFYDIAARPHIIDFEGANSSTLNRAPLIRYDLSVGDDTFSIAVENPTEQITLTGDAVVENQNIPDILSSYKLRWNNKKDFVKFAALLRQLRYSPANGDIDSKLGWGGLFTGKINTFGKDNIKFQILGGSGIARYIEGVRGLGYDGILDEDSNSLETLDIYGGFLAYQHHWSDHWNSSIVVGTTRLDDNDLFAQDDFKSGDYASVNLFYEPLSWMLYGVEYLYGRRENIDGAMPTEVGFNLERP